MRTASEALAAWPLSKRALACTTFWYTSGRAFSSTTRYASFFIVHLLHTIVFVQ